MDLREKFAQACRDVAADVKAGAKLGAQSPEVEVDGVECPHCAIGHVAVRCGFQPRDAYALFELFDVLAAPIWKANDDAFDGPGPWTWKANTSQSARVKDLAKALQDAADEVME